MAFTEKKFNVDKFNELIGKFDEESNVEKYYHDLVDSWLQRGKLRYQDYSSWIEDLEDWWTLEEAFFYLSKVYVNSQTSDLDELRQKINKEEHIFRLVASRSLDVSEILVRKANDMSSTFLADFNWTVKLATSSDKLARLNEPLCSLRLVKNDKSMNSDVSCKREEGNQIYHTRNANESITSFEMSRTEVKNLIRILENIQNKFDIYESQRGGEQ